MATKGRVGGVNASAHGRRRYISGVWTERNGQGKSILDFVSASGAITPGREILDFQFWNLVPYTLFHKGGIKAVLWISLIAVALAKVIGFLYCLHLTTTKPSPG